MASFPSSEARHTQRSHGGGVDVDSSGDPPPATSCHVALDIPEPVHKSDDHTAVAQQDIVCLRIMFKGMYVLAIVFYSYSFIQYVATTKMTWDKALDAFIITAVAGSLFFAVAFAFKAEEQMWKARLGISS